MPLLMPQPRKRSNKPSAKNDTPLDSQKAKIAEQAAKVRAKLEQYQRVIDEAPKKKEERQRVEREEFVARKSRTEARTHSRAALPDLRRYYLNVGAPNQQKKLRAERNRGRRMFFMLLVVFAFVAIWFYLTFRP